MGGESGQQTYSVVRLHAPWGLQPPPPPPSSHVSLHMCDIRGTLHSLFQFCEA